MDILFENTLVRSKATLKELYRYIYFRRPLILAITIMLLFVFFLNLVTLMLFSDVNCTIILLVPLFFAVHFWSYANTVSTVHKRDLESFGGEIAVKIEVTDNCIRQHLAGYDNGAASKVELSNVKNAVITKNLILVFTKARLIYALQKDSFQIGDANGFVAFLRSKGIKVKGK